jgi:hypothetical protein
MPTQTTATGLEVMVATNPQSLFKMLEGGRGRRTSRLLKIPESCNAVLRQRVRCS